MNAPDRLDDWTGANQRLLVAEFARLKRRLAGDDAASAAAEGDVEARRAGMPAPAAVDALSEAFALSGFERDLLLLAAGVEMDAVLAAACADAQGPPRRPWATFGLALALLPQPHWSALAPSRPLRRWRLIEVDADGAGAGLVDARLRIDERVLHHLAGLDEFDARLEPLLRAVDPPTRPAPRHDALAASIAARLRRDVAPWPAIQLHGDDATGRERVAASVTARLGLRLYALEAAALPPGRDALATLATLWEREATLGGLALLVEADADEGIGAEAMRWIERVRGLLFVSTGEPVRLRRPAVSYKVGAGDGPERREAWHAALGERFPAAAIDAVAGQFRLDARALGEIAADASSGADGAALWRACREASPAAPAGLACRVETVACWDDLVLPAWQKQVLGQIAVHMRQRLRVFEEWGFASKSSSGLGISALFAGESGTGKTMAAEALARELQLELWRIDLAMVVSKYIGETEKNLRRVFDAAEASGAMLLFDEADALFGKRAEVRDSHDRYANIEVSYLLQRIETFGGLAILTSNHKASIDTAFMRRLRFVVHFPFPEAAEREALWRASFPAATPLAGVDFAKLARLDATGGAIRNIAVHAAFMAADGGSPVTMAHLLRAAHLEAAKRERPVSDAETRGWT